MADVNSSLNNWSTTASSNNPQGSTSIGTGLDDNLREIQAAVRAWLANKGSDLASAATVDLGATAGSCHDVTGTTTITSLGSTGTAGLVKVLKFEGALTLTHNATSLILPGGANITTADGDMAQFTCEGSGNWRCNWYTVAATVPGLSVPVCDFRLTLTTGTPVTTADVTGATTIYCAPYKGNRIALYDGSNWNVRTSAEFSLALGTLTSGLPYDVFCYDNSGTPTLEFTAWTNATTRATALTTQNGVLVKTGATTRRYLGTFYTTATTTTEDSAAKRLLWNYYHRVRRPMRAVDTTNTWTYTTATFRQANANAANQLEYVQGVSEDAVSADVFVGTSNSNTSGTVVLAVGVGVDSTSTNSAQLVTGNHNIASMIVLTSAHYKGFPGVGRHTLAWLERSTALGTTTWLGDNGDSSQHQSGIHGEVWA